MPAAAKEKTIPSVWTRPRRGRREQPALSREHIVAEAILLLDAEGVDALSMRRLGARLNAGATSLYSHVANKDELIELVVDEVYGEMEVPDAGGPEGWRAGSVASAQSLLAVILRHPWLVSVLGGASFSSLGPNMLRITDRLLAVFEAGGFPLAEADRAMKALLAYVVGMGTSAAAFLTALSHSGQTQEEWAERMVPVMSEAVRPYPMLNALFDARQGDDLLDTSTDLFGYGLDRMLDGLEARLAGLSGPA
ncbi:TetR/AcrR family transcriptional regulator [Streptomyces bambusae]|uniref:TetR/AcrR family transcriptional regulator C-terminal domain-containing protein n=1 Tax=Streptomyces bambusae TaxID=1550616 RepID=UPI001CFF7A75|nr:TetR/AcrR family transcriptional regulator C-terminal domain-containing protein [Streptomyces bambusae]MCB5169625.1 TetR/AcrR family transcriptional regulator [Streptomyces bambusae]